MTAPKAMNMSANHGPFELVYSSGGTGGPYKTEEDAKEGAERRIGGEQWIAIVPSRQINDLTKAKYEWLLKRGKKWEKGPRPLPNVAPHAHYFEATSPVVEFEDALLADRLALRFAMEHDSPEALQKYLEQHPDADRSKHTVKKSEGERGSAKDDDSKAETKGKDDKPKKLQTFQKARAGLMDHLKDKGWKMSAPGLKIPHATSPDGKLRIWFKPQAIWYSSGTKHDLQGARSIHTDIRSTDPEKVVQEAQRYAR